jgi:hypothetical protein
MSSFDPASGVLTASRADIGALVTLVTGAAGAADADAVAVDAMLADAGAGSLADPHPRLAEALAPLRRPIVGVRLGKTGFVMPGWIGEGRFTLHAYRGGDDDQLVSMPGEHIVHFLLWLLKIGPRPRDPRPAETRVDADVLNRAVALRLGGRPSEGLLPEPLDAAVAHGFRDWWLASSNWPPAPGAQGSIALEAIDTDAGLWSVQQLDDGTAVVRPVTPLSTMLALGDLVPDAGLVDSGAPRLPLEDTPVLGGPISWVADVLG